MCKVCCIICKEKLAWIPDYENPETRVCVDCGMEHGERLDKAVIKAYVRETIKIRGESKNGKKAKG